MAASQVVGFHWIDDTGTWQNPNGNGTPINDAELQKIISEINSIFLMADARFGGRLNAEGFGSHTFAAAGATANAVVVRNTQAGSTALARLVAQGNGANTAALEMASTTYTPTLGLLADGARVVSSGAGGLSLVAANASGDVRILSNGGTAAVTISNAGIASAVGGLQVAGNLLVSHSSSPQIVMRDTDGPTNEKAWTFATNGSLFRIQWLSDDYVSTGVAFELERSGNNLSAVRATAPLEVNNAGFAYNAQLRVGFQASTPSPAVLQSGEPGVHLAHVVLSNNYYGINGGGSGRLNTSVGASFLRLANTGHIGFCRVTNAGVVTLSWTMDDWGHFLPGSAAQDIASDTVPLANTWAVNSYASLFRFRGPGTSYLALEPNGEDLRVRADGADVCYFGSDITPGVLATRVNGTPLGVNLVGNDGVLVSLRKTGQEKGSISVSGETVAYNTFLGSHYTQLQDAQVEPPPGSLLVSTGSLIESGGQERFPYVELSSSRGQKGVYGAWFAKLTDDPGLHTWAKQDRAIFQVAALGLWYLRVTDTGGDIVNGDLLHASPREGLAERQVESDGVTYIPAVLDSTVARARVGVNWITVSPNARGIKEAFIPVTLHAG